VAKFLGEHLMARNANGELKVRIACAFPHAQTIVALPEVPVHAYQRAAFVDSVNSERVAQGKPELGDEEYDAEMERAVDLFVDGQAVLIRPDPEFMDLAFEADELLQKDLPKRLIKFLLLSDPKVRDSLKERGECWRIFLPPTAPNQIRKMIAESRTNIGGRAIYYYSPVSGTRLLTYDNLEKLGTLSDAELRQHLAEIATYSTCRNSNGCAEVELFMGDHCAVASDFEAASVATADQLRPQYEALCQKIRKTIAPEYQRDDLEEPAWRNRMFARLMTQRDDVLVDNQTMGLDPEFSLRVEWRPGGRIDKGELILDPAREERGEKQDERYISSVVDGLILNFVQEYGDLEYINLGSVLPSPKRNEQRGGRREVFIVQFKHRRSPQEVLQIIRMQKWGVRERLDQGKNMETAMVETEEYTEYVLDRRLACRQLGMNLPLSHTVRKVGEIYEGYNAQYRGRRIWSPYFQRDYIPGASTDQIPQRKLTDRTYAAILAQLMGRAAASNIILGRAELSGEVVFDVGDEIVLETAQGLPLQIIVSDHVGTFVDWNGPLEARAPEYAASVKRRLKLVSDPDQFIDAFLFGFTEQLTRVQEEYRRNGAAFDKLFYHRRKETHDGSLPHRWSCVLKRLKDADVSKLAGLIGEAIRK
jgi:hypothetical protein